MTHWRTIIFKFYCCSLIIISGVGHPCHLISQDTLFFENFTDYDGDTIGPNWHVGQTGDCDGGGIFNAVNGKFVVNEKEGTICCDCFGLGDDLEGDCGNNYNELIIGPFDISEYCLFTISMDVVARAINGESMECINGTNFPDINTKCSMAIEGYTGCDDKQGHDEAYFVYSIDGFHIPFGLFCGDFQCIPLDTTEIITNGASELIIIITAGTQTEDEFYEFDDILITGTKSPIITGITKSDDFACEGDTVTLEASIENCDPCSYIWRDENMAIVGTESTLVIESIEAVDDEINEYLLEINNGNCSAFFGDLVVITNGIFDFSIESLFCSDDSTVFDVVEFYEQTQSLSGTASGPGIQENQRDFIPFGLEPGIKTIIFTPSNNCDNSEITLEVTAGTEIEIDPIGPFCVTDGPYSLDTMPGGVHGHWEGPTVVDDLFYPADAGEGDHVLIFTPDPIICPSDVTAVLVTVINPLYAGNDTTSTVCNGKTNRIINFEELLISADFIGVVLDEDNTGVDLFMPDSVSFAGVPGGCYNFLHLLETENCEPDTALIEITVVEAVFAGMDTAAFICNGGSSTLINFTNLLSSADAIDTIIDVNNSQVDLSDLEFLDFFGVPQGSYSYHHILRDQGLCGNDTAVISVLVADPPNAGADTVQFICEGIESSYNLYDHLGGDPLPGGDWIKDTAEEVDISDPSQVDLSNLPSNRAYDFRYVVQGPFCEKSSILTIVVNRMPNAGMSVDIDLCTGGSLFLNLADSIGDHDAGIWSDPFGTGISLDDPTQVDFTGFAPGSYEVHHVRTSGNVCPDDTAKVIVNVFPQPEYSFTGSDCSEDLLSYSISLQANAEDSVLVNFGELSSLGNGSYVVDMIPKDTDLAITILNPSTGCELQKVFLAPDCNCPVIDAPIPLDSIVGICEGKPIPPLEVMAPEGMIVNWYPTETGGDTLAVNTTSYVPGSEGIYYAEAVDTITGCISQTRTSTELIIYDLRDAGRDTLVNICPGPELDLNNLQTGEPGGIYIDEMMTGALNGSIVATSELPEGTYDFIYVVVDDQDCPDDSASIRINILHLPDAGDDIIGVSVCQDAEINLFDLVNGELTGIFFNNQSDTFPGGVLNTGSLDDEIQLQYIVESDSGCGSDTAALQIQVEARPELNLSGIEKLCLNKCKTFSSEIAGKGPFSFNLGVWIDENSIIEFPVETSDNNYEVTICHTPTDFNYFDDTLRINSQISSAQSIYISDIQNPVCTAIGIGFTDSLYIELEDAVNINVDTTLCEDEVIMVEGEIFDIDHPFGSVRIPGIECDTNYIVNVDFREKSTAIIEMGICNGDTVLFGGEEFYSGHLAGQVVIPGANQYACDSIIEVSLQLNDTYFIQSDISICDGDSLFLDGSFRSESGNYTDSLTTSEGCDSVLTTVLTVLDQPSAGSGITDFILCQNDAQAINLFDFIDDNPDLEGSWEEITNFGPDLSDPQIVDFRNIVGEIRLKYRVTNGICTDSTELSISIDKEKEAGKSIVIELCPEEVESINLVEAIGIHDPGQWTESSGSGIDTQDPENVDLSQSEPGSYRFVHRVESELGICPEDSATVQVIILNSPSIIETAKNCSPDLQSYTIQLVVNPNISVQANDGIVQDLGNQMISVEEIPVGIDAMIELLDSLSRCSTMVTISAPDCNCPILDAPVIAGNATIIEYCKGTGIPILTVNIQEDLSANWYDLASGGFPLISGSTVFNPPGPGIYYAESTDTLNGCISQERTEISLIEKASFALNINQTICEGDSLFAAGEWQKESGTYLNNYQSSKGCDSTEMIILTVIGNPTAGSGQLDVHICQTNANVVNLFSYLGTEYDPNGNWIDRSGYGLDLSSPNAVDLSHLTGDVVFSYTVSNGLCEDSTRVGLIIEIPFNAGQSTEIEFCETQDTVLNLNDLIGLHDEGIWTDINSGEKLNDPPQIVINSLTPGTYSFDHRRTGSDSCPEDSAIVAVVIFENPQILYFNPDCDPDLNTYHVELQTSENILVDVDAGILNDLGAGFFMIEDIPSDDDILVNLTDTVSGCYSKLNISPPDCSCPALIPPEIINSDSLIEFCGGNTIPQLEVSVPEGLTTDWYDADVAGELVTAQATEYSPLAPGFYYAETVDPVSGCISGVRTAFEVRELQVFETQSDLAICVGDSVYLSGVWQYDSGNFMDGFTAKNGCDSVHITNLTVQDCTVSLNIQTEDVICKGDSTGTITFTVQGLSIDSFEYAWMQVNGPLAAQGQVPNNDQALVLNNLPAGTYQIEILETTGRPLGMGEAVISFMSDLRAEIFVESENLCSNGADGILAIEIYDGQEPFMVQWSTGQTGLTDEGLVPGDYSVTITDDLLCEIVLYESLHVPADPEINVHATDAFCPEIQNGMISVELLSADVPPYEYSLNGLGFGPDPLFSGLDIGSYLLTVKDGNACLYDFDDIVINYMANLEIILPGSFAISAGDSIKLTPEFNFQPVNVEWSPGQGLSCTDCISPTIIPEAESDYLITAFDDRGCSVSKLVRINFELTSGIYIPNVVDPGSDINQSFYPRVRADITGSMDMIIFDRWGNEVFRLNNAAVNDPNSSWNINYSGEKVNPGVYVYYILIRTNEGTELKFAGDLTVVN